MTINAKSCKSIEEGQLTHCSSMCKQRHLYRLTDLGRCVVTALGDDLASSRPE